MALVVSPGTREKTLAFLSTLLPMARARGELIELVAVMSAIRFADPGGFYQGECV